MKRFIFFLVGLAIVGVLCVGLMRKGVPEAIVIPVTQGMAVNAVPGNVKVVAEATYFAKSEASGILSEVVKIPSSGSLKVRKGDFIAKLDTKAIDKEVELLAERCNAARERVEIGSHLELVEKTQKETLEHYEVAHARGECSDIELTKKQREYDSTVRLLKLDNLRSELELKQARAELETKLEFRKKMTIKSPVDACLTEFQVMVDDYVSINRNVAKLISEKCIAEITINEEDFPGVKLDQPVTINLTGYGNDPFQGRIKTVFPSINSNNKYTVLVAFDAPQEMLTPGMSGQASIIKSKNEDALIIPRQALLGNLVYTVEKGRVRIKKVEPGFIAPHIVEIRSGVKEGELVLIEDILTFREGEYVRPKAPVRL